MLPSINLEEIIFQALGEASMCWDESPKGVFDSQRAKQIGEDLLQAIKKHDEELLEIYIDMKKQLDVPSSRSLTDEALEHIALDRSSPLPLYFQLKEALRKEINAGRFNSNAAIPSEPEFVIHLHVSRATVRQAITELVHEGLLYREHGKGTFVREQQSLMQGV